MGKTPIEARRIRQETLPRLSPEEALNAAPEAVKAFFARIPALVTGTKRRSWRALIEELVEVRLAPLSDQWGPPDGCSCTKPVKEGRSLNAFATWVHQNHRTFAETLGQHLSKETRYHLCEGIERYLSTAERDPDKGAPAEVYPHELVRALQDWLMTPIEPDFAQRFYNGKPLPWRRKGRRKAKPKAEPTET